MPTEQFFADRMQASQVAAQRIADAIKLDLGSGDTAAIAVCGGTTPRTCYTLLADADLPWERIRVVLTDERWVPPEHAASNELLLRQTLLQRRASKAQMVPLFAQGPTLAERCMELNHAFNNLPLPFSTVLLGMGEDGHFASLFPDFNRLEEGLDPAGMHRCLPVTTAASPHQRVSLTLSMLLQSREILLLFFGEAKRQIYERARRGDSGFPINRLLLQQRTPVHVLWAA